MRFFADHCVPESVAEALETEGHEVLRLRTQMATDAPDTDVIEKAQTLDVYAGTARMSSLSYRVYRGQHRSISRVHAHGHPS